jgi:hypothetical protein
LSVSTKIFEISKYPIEFPIQTEPVIVEGAAHFELRTKADSIGFGEYQQAQLEKLMINHDKGKKFEGVGYSEENGRIDDITSLAEDKEFPAFVFPNKDYIIAAYTSKEVYNGAFKRLRSYASVDKEKENDKLYASPVKLNLQKLKESYDATGTGPETRGGWFKKLKINNVDVAYIGGGGVDDSDEWFKYETSGTISALRLDFPNVDLEEEPYRFMITSDGSIFCYKTLTENEMLKILYPIYCYIIAFKE